MNKQLILSIMVVASLLAVLPASVSADQYVSTTSDIQAAVDQAAANGGTVYFASGEYYVNIVIDTPARSFTLKGAGSEESELYADDDGAVIKVVNTGANVVTIEGFGIREGTGDTSGYVISPCGGGLYSNYANLVVENCRFQNNEAGYGGGMYNENYTYGDATYSNSGDPPYAVVVRDCHFEDNGANYGGGMYNYEVASISVINCTFEENYASVDGGGMYNDNSNVVVESCTFDRNEAGNEGGGMVNYYSSSASASPGGDTDYDGEILTEDIVTLSVSNCTFTNNEAGNRGGGMYNEEYSAPLVSKCIFVGNEAIRGGGGMHNHDSSAPVVTNCVFVANVVIGESDTPRGIDGQAEIIRSAGGGGMFSGPYATPVVTNCTFTLNTVPYYSNKGDYDGENGGGVKNANNSSSVFTNCIIWGNVCGDDPNDVLNTDGNTSTFEYCNIGGGFPGEGNIDADPLFVNAPTNLSLGAGSPCIDTGTNLVSWGSLGGVMDDILGTPRPQRLGYDMGAYEYVGTSFSPVIIQPLARTQLQSVLSLWEELLSRLPEEPTDEMASLIAQIQEHVGNAAQLTNPIYASGQLSKAAAAMQQLAALLA
ncbi:MAG: right-handed parallel beta-helix repeat-containing protein [Candidatus Methanofastidiosa archaeon]|nr:right-handed parallel beta-helix repeat-containing protein [Candidatus Methanofastidiosa archaeon]